MYLLDDIGAVMTFVLAVSSFTCLLVGIGLYRLLRRNRYRLLISIVLAVAALFVAARIVLGILATV